MGRLTAMVMSLSPPFSDTPAPGATGRARVDRRTKNLTKRLRPGDIAVIDHEDIDRVSAEALGGVPTQRLIINASAVHHGPLSQCRAADSGRGRGARHRCRGHGPDGHLSEGVAADRGRRGVCVTRCVPGTASWPAGGMLTAEGVGATPWRWLATGPVGQIEAFAQNTMEYLVREKDLLIDGVGVPDIKHRSRAGTR
jgi:hypothetical protein